MAKTVEDVWDKLGDIPMPKGTAASARLNWNDYDRACMRILAEWRTEIQECAAGEMRARAVKECRDLMGVKEWATDSDVSPEVAAAWDKAAECCARGIHELPLTDTVCPKCVGFGFTIGEIPAGCPPCRHCGGTGRRQSTPPSQPPKDSDESP